MKSIHRAAMPAALAGVCLLIAACGDREAGAGETTAAEPTNQTVAAVIADEDSLGALEGVVENAGLKTVLEGAGPYTFFAPSETALGGSAEQLSQDEMKAQSAALLRAHIVPGALTRADIAAAIERKGGPVEMRTMADGVLTFSQDGEAIVVGGPGGAQARLTGDEVIASNGVVQPVDASLAAPSAA
jgi:uncharacterized surface protein with fasciclin (FAS1) repeats